MNVLITGATAGFGLAIARRYIQDGACVIATGRRTERLEAMRAEWGERLLPVTLDITDREAVEQAVRSLPAAFAEVDVLVNNAGLALGLDLAQSARVEDWDTMVDTNVKGLLFTVQKGLPLLSEGAAVILNGSVVSIKGIEGMGVYNATKAAVRSFARTWTAEMKGRGIRVNVVSPGPIDTPGLDLLVGPGNAEGFKAAMAAAVPLGRVGSADEIAKAVTFLASADASYVAGVELFVDGGMAQV